MSRRMALGHELSAQQCQQHRVRHAWSAEIYEDDEIARRVRALLTPDELARGADYS
jgi:hypothetical protein